MSVDVVVAAPKLCNCPLNYCHKCVCVVGKDQLSPEEGRNEKPVRKGEIYKIQLLVH